MIWLVVVLGPIGSDLTGFSPFRLVWLSTRSIGSLLKTPRGLAVALFCSLIVVINDWYTKIEEIAIQLIFSLSYNPVLILLLA